jgi:hypothetical protein
MNDPMNKAIRRAAGLPDRRPLAKNHIPPESQAMNKIIRAAAGVSKNSKPPARNNNDAKETK